MCWQKIKERCFVLWVLGKFSAWNTLVTGEIWHTSIASAKNAAKMWKIACRNKKLQKLTKIETHKKLCQFARHGQNCELAAKRENNEKVRARKIANFCKDHIVLHRSITTAVRLIGQGLTLSVGRLAGTGSQSGRVKCGVQGAEN